jgi:hypothetical protein
MADNYTDLIAEIGGYLGRKDIPYVRTFIKDAEAIFNRDLRLRMMESATQTAISSDAISVTLPNNRYAPDDEVWLVFLEMRNVRLGSEAGDQTLEYVVPSAMPSMDMSGHAFAGRPQQYTILQNELYVWPKPDREYTLTLNFYAEIPPLDDDHQANDLLLKAPDVYRYGALVQSAGYTRSSAPVEMWASLYAKAVQSLIDSDKAGSFAVNKAVRPHRCI